MFNLHETLSLHKETVLFGEGGFNVKCKLKPYQKHEGYSLTGFTTFTGCTFTKDGEAIFGDTFEITLDLNAIRKYTTERPVQGWYIVVQFPQLNNKEIEFRIENAPPDRLIGTILLKCSAVANTGNGTRINRGNTGGI